jgi:hypothetical protein
MTFLSILINRRNFFASSRRQREIVRELQREMHGESAAR